MGGRQVEGLGSAADHHGDARMGQGAVRAAKAGAASASLCGVMRWGLPMISKTLSPDRLSWAGATIRS